MKENERPVIAAGIADKCYAILRGKTWMKPRLQYLVPGHFGKVICWVGEHYVKDILVL